VCFLGSCAIINKDGVEEDNDKGFIKLIESIFKNPQDKLSLFTHHKTIPTQSDDPSPEVQSLRKKVVCYFFNFYISHQIIQIA
jgi:hypothetical protein